MSWRRRIVILLAVAPVILAISMINIWLKSREFVRSDAYGEAVAKVQEYGLKELGCKKISEVSSVPLQWSFQSEASVEIVQFYISFLCDEEYIEKAMKLERTNGVSVSVEIE